jgi:hypothetical protein
MLDESAADAAIIKRWLTAALESADYGKKASLAAYCGVTPQAVNGWLRTGRMRHGPQFRSGPAQAREPAPAYMLDGTPAWPFKQLSLRHISSLSADTLARLEGAWLVAAAHLGVKVTDD